MKPLAISYPSRPHASGQARIKIRGKEIYLGRFGSPESRVKFYRVLAEYQASGALPGENSTTTDTTGPTVSELLSSFWEWANVRYVKHGKPTSEVTLYRSALGPAFDLYGDTLARDFGPLKLTACRDELVRRGYCRSKVNQHVGRIRRVWKWGVSRELVEATTWQALRSVEGLRKGEASEPPPIACVPGPAVAAIQPYVLPPIWAMVQLQLWTGMRPGEVVAMRTRDILEGDPAMPAAVRGLCWVYRPGSHKTEHHDRTRVILLGPQAQDIARAWLRPDSPDACLFSPREAVAYARAQRAAARKTKVYKRFARKRHPKRAPRDGYSAHSYARAIAKACLAADIEPWAPNRLRHNAATLIRQRYGVEVARVILGHAHLKTTEVYAEIDLERAARAIAETG